MIGRNGLPDLNPSGVQLLDFFASCSVALTDTMVLKVVHLAPAQPTPDVNDRLIKPSAKCTGLTGEERW